MKTKFLFTAMALPLVFAACSQEELVVENKVAAEREVVGNVNLQFNYNGGVESRFGWNGGYYFSKGDQLGACLMDEITSSYTDYTAQWDARFDLVNYIQTNYPFTRDAEGVWSTEAKLLEGNYFFCFPYNVNAGKREAYKFSVATQVMEGTDMNSLKKAYANNNGFIGFTTIGRGAEQGEAQMVDMIDVFGATGLVFKNTGTNTYKIEKLVLNGSKVAHTATVTPSVDNNGTDVFSPQVFENMYGTYYTDNNAVLRNALAYDDNQEIELFINSGNSVAPQKSINALVMLQNVALSAYKAGSSAAAQATQTQALLDIYTDKGIIRDVALNKKYTSNTGAINDVTNVLTDVALTKLGNGEKIVITFDDTSLDVPTELLVSSTDELASLVHWNAGANTDITANLEGNVNITKAIYNELVNSDIKKLTINGNSKTVTIDADVAATALDEIEFANVAKIIVKGTQTLAADKNCPIQNEGTINIAADVTATVNNYGTLIVNKTTSVTINNNKTMTVAAGAKTMAQVCNNVYNNVAATIDNNGTILKLTNAGTVTNAGVLGTSAVQTYDITDDVTNSGTIYNNGTAKAFIGTNTGNVYANENSTTRLNENLKNIIITNLAEDGNFKATTIGSVVQEITEAASVTSIDARANKIWLSATLNVDAKDKDGNYVAFDLNAAAKNGPVAIVAKGANARINGNNNVLYVNTIVVEEASKLVLNKVNVIVRLKDENGNYVVSMKGKANKVSTLTVNSNASLCGTRSAAVWVQVANTANNIIDNNSSSSDIDVATVTEFTAGL